MKRLTFAEAMTYANEIGIVEIIPEYKLRDGTGLILANDEMLVSFSNYESDLSDVTPGRGILPPTFFVFTKNQKIKNPD